MPRTVDEILQHADELAARFEDYEPNPADELDPGAVALLRAAIQERSDAERHVLDAIKAAQKPACLGRLSGSSSAPQGRQPASATGRELHDVAGPGGDRRRASRGQPPGGPC